MGRDGKRTIITFELLDHDQDIAKAFAGLPGHMTKSGLIRLALRSYLGGADVPVPQMAGALSLNLGAGDIINITRQKVSDDQLEDLLDNALGGF